MAQNPDSTNVLQCGPDSPCFTCNNCLLYNIFLSTTSGQFFLVRDSSHRPSAETVDWIIGELVFKIWMRDLLLPNGHCRVCNKSLGDRLYNFRRHLENSCLLKDVPKDIHYCAISSDCTYGDKRRDNLVTHAWEKHQHRRCPHVGPAGKCPGFVPVLAGSNAGNCNNGHPSYMCVECRKAFRTKDARTKHFLAEHGP